MNKYAVIFSSNISKGHWLRLGHPTKLASSILTSVREYECILSCLVIDVLFSLCILYPDSEIFEESQHSSGSRGSVCEEDISEQWCPSCKCNVHDCTYGVCVCERERGGGREGDCLFENYLAFLVIFSIHASVSGAKAQMCSL